jgi:hypothetical protein
MGKSDSSLANDPFEDSINAKAPAEQPVTSLMTTSSVAAIAAPTRSEQKVRNKQERFFSS